MSDSNVLQPQTRVLQHIPRWGVVRTLRQQSVAEHSYYVALYATWIAKFMGCSDGEVLYITTMAMVHDFDEMVSGDIPTPYKRHLVGAELMKAAPDAMGLSIVSGTPCIDITTRIIRVADLFEAIMFLRDEIAMGNSTVKGVFRSLWSDFRDSCKDVDEGLYKELCPHISDKTRTRLLTFHGLK